MPSNSLFSCGYPYGSPFCESCPIDGEFCSNKGLSSKPIEHRPCCVWEAVR
ncbi:MAG TPA: hypothetical protein VGK06_01735 [Methanosarcina sp.]